MDTARKNETCVIGGGLMGLALARKLANDGHVVTVLEREEQLGGLATYHDFGGFYWDRFYHVILPSDQHLIQFVDDLGLAEKLFALENRNRMTIVGNLSRWRQW